MYRNSREVVDDLLALMYGSETDPVATARAVKREFAAMDERRRRNERVTPAPGKRIGRFVTQHPASQKEESIDPKTVLHHINNFPYKLINIPDVMSQRSEYELDPTTAGPVKLPFGYEVGQGMFTINWMIQNYAKGVPFEFAKWEDTLSVAKYLGKYVELLEKDVKAVEAELQEDKVKGANLEALDNASAYLHMAKELYAVIEPMSKRLKNYYDNIPTAQDRVVAYEIKMRKRALGFADDEAANTRDSKPEFTSHLLARINRTRRK